MNYNEDISFLLFMKCDPTSVLPLSLVCKQYRSVFLARQSVICQSHVERRIMTTFSAKDQAKQQKDLQKKLHIITMNFDHVRPCLADANQIFHDFCKKRWWQRQERYQLYSAIKNRSEWYQIHKISPQTINYIFKVWNGAVYYVEAQEANDIIFSIVFAPKEDEEDTADNLTETRLKWLQDNFGKKFPKRNLIFLNPSDEMCEYRRSMYEHVNVDGDAGSSGNDVSSSSEPQFSKYVQIPLETALRRAIRGLSAEPESKSDAGMELFDYLNRYPTCESEVPLRSEICHNGAPSEAILSLKQKLGKSYPLPLPALALIPICPHSLLPTATTKTPTSASSNINNNTMNCSEDIIFLLFTKCDPTSVLPLSLVCKQYRNVFLARQSVICQSHVERRINATFSATSKAQQQTELQQQLHRKVGWGECKDQIITLNQDFVKPCLADAYQIFLDFGKKRWWNILTSYNLYSAIKDRSAWFEEFKISLRTVNYIFNLFNGAVYDADIHGDEMIFGIIFGPDVDEDTRLKWLQEKFGKEFPKMDLIFLNPSNETLEYRRPKHDASSSSMPRFLGYYQIPLKTAIEHALGRLSREPDSRNDAGMALVRYLNRSPTNHERDAIWNRCCIYFPRK
ncbi:hypothetical protein HDU78_007927 [Chytriomyces hyalinus]|nr:hypothetical protein HDU78_007927 [Chytriomyces hyalinus]